MPAAQFQVETDRKLLHALSGGRRHVLIRVTAPTTEPQVRRPVRLGLVLDRSASMAGEKLRLAREAVVSSIGRLSASDLFTVVCFDDKVHIVVPATLATSEAKRDAIFRVRAVSPGGNTDLQGGWLRGCEQIGRALSEDSIGRVIVATDGLANCGITDPEAIWRGVAEQREQGTATSTIGVGQHFAEQLLGRMADVGGGHFYYVEKDSDLQKAIENEVTETLDVVARDVEIVVRAQPSVSIESISAYAVRRSLREWTIPLGDMIAGQQLSLVLAVDFPSGCEGESCALSFEARDRDGAIELPAEPLRYTWASPPGSDQQPGDRAVEREVAQVYAARARCEASDLNRRGRHELSARTLQRVANKIRTYADGDAELLALVADLSREAFEASQPLDAVARKRFFARGHATLKSRDSDGKALLRDSQPGRVPSDSRPRIMIVPASRRLHAAINEAISEASYPPRSSSLSQYVELILWRHLSAITLAGAADGFLDAQSESRLVQAVSTLPGEGPRFVFTEMALRDHWFSHWHAAEQVVVVSTAGWHQLTPLPLSAFIAYELLLHGFRALCPGYDPTRLLHEETRGCIFDLCRRRKDITSKLQLGDICEDCRNGLAHAGAPFDAFFAFCARIRSLSQGVCNVSNG